ncbi:MAG: hypothetical protein QXK06_02275 [Candidatus Diapherotrites archaeon]
MVSKKEASIVNAIRTMMQSGEPEEKIIATLIEMGVKPDQAKRLVMVGQADTLTLIQEDIGRIARTQIENEIPALKKMVEDTLEKAQRELKKTVKEELDEELELFRRQVNEDLKLINEVNSSFEGKIAKVDEKTEEIKAEIKEMQMKRLGTKNEWISFMLMAGGVIFNVFAFYMVYIEFTSQSITLDSLILIMVMALTGITMLFGSTII